MPAASRSLPRRRAERGRGLRRHRPPPSRIERDPSVPKGKLDVLRVVVGNLNQSSSCGHFLPRLSF